MDHTAELNSSYAASLSYSDLTTEAIHATKRAIIDSLGCAMGGYLAEPSKIARRLAGLVNIHLDIADELVISLNTGGHHVSHILSKTGSANRTEVAPDAAQHDQTP